MQCPKCDELMEQVTCNQVVIDRCLGCRGLWFDNGEAESLSDRLVATFIDTGDPVKGQVMDDIDDIACPHCGHPMRRFFDIEASQVQYEECDEHSKFFDAGEFTTWVEAQCSCASVRRIGPAELLDGCCRRHC